MTRNLLIFILILFPFQLVYSSNYDEMADSAYSEDNFKLAADLYLEYLKKEGNSSVIQYNLGNCYYRMGELGKAIIAYERALRLNPRFKEAKINLGFVNSKIIDKPGEKGSFLSNMFDAGANKAKSNVWGWLGLGFFTCFLVSLGLYFFSSSLTIKKFGFFLAIFLIFITLGSLILSFRAKQISLNNKSAIIIAPSVILSTSPREPKDRNEEAILLHEGTKVEIIDSISNRTDSLNIKWLEVQIDNTHRAWIKASDVERI